MTVVICPKCGNKGSLQPKKVKDVVYWRIAHYRGLKGKTRQVKWCYIGKELPESIREQLRDIELITQKEQVITENDYSKKNSKTSFKSQKNDDCEGKERGRGPVWSKIRAWGVRGPGFKSPRPHQ
jgi:hypothetical protein